MCVASTPNTKEYWTSVGEPNGSLWYVLCDIPPTIMSLLPATISELYEKETPLEAPASNGVSKTIHYATIPVLTPIITHRDIP
jgi:hypothetical protein